MPRSKHKPQSLPPLPPDGEIKERRSIRVAYYWICEGYGSARPFETFNAAMAAAKKDAPDAESTGQAVIHIIETYTKTTVVRAS